MLTDDEILKMLFPKSWDYLTGAALREVLSDARKIESAATAPLLARIEALDLLLRRQAESSASVINRLQERIAALTSQVEHLTATASSNYGRGHADAHSMQVENHSEQHLWMVEQADPMCRVAKSKLADLISQGYRECGVMIARTDEEGTVQRGAVSNGGMVIWWHTPQIHEPQQVEQAAQPVAGLVRCEFDDECDFCKTPSGGTFTRLTHNAEDVTEAEFYICGDCVSKAVTGYTTQSKAEPITYERLHKVWESDNGLEDCNMRDLTDFNRVVRFVEYLHGITPAKVEKEGE